MCLHAGSEIRRAETPPDRAARAEAGRGRGLPRLRVRAEQFKPFTYSVMHLCVAVTVAFALTRDWRIALGVGVIEPMVQTLAYTLHEAAWARGVARRRS